jgi:hypothetical protein
MSHAKKDGRRKNVRFKTQLEDIFPPVGRKLPDVACYLVCSFHIKPEFAENWQFLVKMNAAEGGVVNLA